MKKIIINIVLILFIPVSAQVEKTIQQSANTRGGRLFTDNVVFQVNSENKNLSYDDIKGSPYYDKNFSLTKFFAPENVEIALSRYNSYTDEIEIKKDSNIYALPPNNPFTKIEITETKETLVQLYIDEDLKGYFFELVSGTNSLYKKIKTKLNNFVPAGNFNLKDKPANFETLEPIYCIKMDKGFIKKPKNQRTIIEQFPDKKDVLTDFFKANKIKFDKEEDLKKLVIFLNQ